MMRTIKLGLAGLAVAAAALFMAAPANAADYTGDCANAPTSNQGNVIITGSSNPGACTISRQVNATGYISITGVSGPISTKGFNAAGSLTVSASSGNSVTIDGEAVSSGGGAINITGDSVEVDGAVTTSTNGIYIEARGNSMNVTAAINANDVGVGSVNVTGPINTTNGGVVIIKADSTLQTGSITTSNGGGIDLKAQTSGGNSLFTIGGSGHTNGVNGTLTTTGNGGTPTNFSSTIYVTNGTESSTGGITLNSTSNISALAGPNGSRAGTIILQAQNGTLTMPAGTLSVAGTGVIGGGQINLLANTISFTLEQQHLMPAKARFQRSAIK